MLNIRVATKVTKICDRHTYLFLCHLPKQPESPEQPEGGKIIVEEEEEAGGGRICWRSMAARKAGWSEKGRKELRDP